MGKGVTQKSLFIGDFLEKIIFFRCFVQFLTHSDPWLESLETGEFYGIKREIFGAAIWGTEFW